MLVVFVNLAWYVGLGSMFVGLGPFVCWVMPMDQEGLGPLYVM